MTLIYGAYTITGTVDEIREFIRKETPCTVSGTATAIMKESNDNSLFTIECPHCGSRNVFAYNTSGTASNDVTEIKRLCRCNDCGKYFDMEV